MMPRLFPLLFVLSGCHWIDRLAAENWTGSFTGRATSSMTCPWGSETVTGEVTLSLQAHGEVLSIPTLGCGVKADAYGSRATLRQTTCAEVGGRRIVYTDGNLWLSGDVLDFEFTIRHEYADATCVEHFEGTLYRP